MRILQVISHYVPAYRFGGPLQVAHSIGKALVASGHKVTVVTTNQKDAFGDLSVPVDKPVDVDGVTVYYEPVPCFRRWGFSPGLTRRVRLEAPEADAVLVHAHFQHASWAGARIARHCGRPYVVFAHSSLRRVAIKASSGMMKSLYLRLLERRNLSRATFIAFNAEEEMADSVFAGHGRVIPNGIDPRMFDSPPPAGTFRSRHPRLAGKVCFLFLGRIDIRQKAVDVIVEGFARLAAERKDAALVLAGPSEGNDADAVRRLVAQHGLGDRVVMPGLISGAEKLAVLRDCDAFLMPSRYEGLSIALLEAMYSGLPVVLSDRAGLHRKVSAQGCGCVVTPDSTIVAQALGRMMDLDFRRRAGACAHQLVASEHTWERIAERLVQELRG